MFEENRIIKGSQQGKEVGWGMIVLVPFLFTFLLSMGMVLVTTLGQVLGVQSEYALAIRQYAQYGVSSALAGGMIILLVLKVNQRSLKSIGLQKAKALQHYFLGVGIAGVALVVIMLFLKATGQVELQLAISHPPLEMLGLVSVIVIAWVLLGAAEEIFIRGYMFQAITSKVGLYKSILITAVLYAFLHIGPSVGAISLINMLLSSVALVLLVLKQKSLWGACGFHTAWNFIQGNVFGIEVSGNALAGQFFKTTLQTPSVWNGGSYGIEGSLLTTFFLIGFIIVLVSKLKTTLK